MLVLDTGVMFALVDTRERQHERCRSLVESVREPLVIPAPTLCEVDHFMHTRGRVGGTQAILRDIRAGAYLVEDLEVDDLERIVQILDRYADLDVGFVDAAVLAIVERLNEPKLATLDRKHFGAMRPRHVGSLELLPA